MHSTTPYYSFPFSSRSIFCRYGITKVWAHNSGSLSLLESREHAGRRAKPVPAAWPLVIASHECSATDNANHPAIAVHDRAPLLPSIAGKSKQQAAVDISGGGYRPRVILCTVEETDLSFAHAEPPPPDGKHPNAGQRRAWSRLCRSLGLVLRGLVGGKVMGNVSQAEALHHRQVPGRIKAKNKVRCKPSTLFAPGYFGVAAVTFPTRYSPPSAPNPKRRASW